MINKKVLGRQEYEGPFKGERYKEKDGLLFDTGDFCCIIKNDGSECAKEIINRSGLQGDPFLVLDCVPIEAFSYAIPGVHCFYVDIEGAIVESSTLAKLLNAIGEWNVEFYKISSTGFIGIKARKEDYRADKPSQQRTVNRGVIAQQEMSTISMQSSREFALNIEIPTIQELLNHYYHGARVYPEFSLKLWGQGKLAVLKVRRFSLSKMAWEKKAYFHDSKNQPCKKQGGNA